MKASVRPLGWATFPGHGKLGLLLVGVFWGLNWALDGLRTHWAFFPLWLGYCLVVDGLVLVRTGTSLLTRSRVGFAGLFATSAPVWWIFEAFNALTRNWIYVGAESFSPLSYGLWTTLSFTTVIPAVFGTAELVGSFAFVQRLRAGPRLGERHSTVLAFFLAGLAMLMLLLAAPRRFYAFLWLALYFILEPINLWLGNRTLAARTRLGDWRPVIALWAGVLVTAFFWEMWNSLSLPKWTYDVPGVTAPKLFEMPLPGYGGYLPFSMELFAIYHFVLGLAGKKQSRYIVLAPDQPASAQELMRSQAVPERIHKTLTQNLARVASDREPMAAMPQTKPGSSASDRHKG